MSEAAKPTIRTESSPSSKPPASGIRQRNGMQPPVAKLSWLGRRAPPGSVVEPLSEEPQPPPSSSGLRHETSTVWPPSRTSSEPASSEPASSEPASSKPASAEARVSSLEAEVDLGWDAEPAEEADADADVDVDVDLEADALAAKRVHTVKAFPPPPRDGQLADGSSSQAASRQEIPPPRPSQDRAPLDVLVDPGTEAIRSSMATERMSFVQDLMPPPRTRSDRVRRAAWIAFAVASAIVVIELVIIALR